MAVNHRAGQIFLIGTILFAGLIAGIVLLDQGGSTTFTGADTAKTIFDRGVDEYPRALNTVLEMDAGADAVKRRTATYLGFHAYTARSRGVDSMEHTVISLPNVSGTTAVIGNFRGTEMENAWIKVDGTSKDLGNLSAGETVKEGFPDASGTFQVMFNATADRTINDSFRASLDSVAALYALRIEGDDQVWTDTRVY